MKTIKKVPYEPVMVEYMPDELEQGKVYISERFGVCKHLCLCGCGEETVLDFGNPTGWRLIKEDNGTVSFTPSVSNYQYPCKAHYIMTKNVANIV